MQQLLQPKSQIRSLFEPASRQNSSNNPTTNSQGVQVHQDTEHGYNGKKNGENEMFVCICKARLWPNRALRVSKSLKLTDLLPQDFSTHPEHGTLCRGLCCCWGLRVDPVEKVRLVQGSCGEAGHPSQPSIPG